MYVQGQLSGFSAVSILTMVRGDLVHAEENGSKGSYAKQPLKEVLSRFLLKTLLPKKQLLVAS